MKVTIVTAATQTDFIVVLVLALVRWALLVVDHSTCCSVGCLRLRFSRSETLSFLCVERSCEFVAVIDPENALVDVQIHGKTEITPVVVFCGFAVFRYSVALKENSLGKSSVFIPIFQDVKSVVLEIVQHGALVDAEILVA